MCNLYSITRSQEAMRRLFGVSRDLPGNLPALPDVFPDQMAPVVRGVEGQRQLEMMRWGMPGPPQIRAAPITNIRNTGPWLGPPSRCLVPVTSFCEYADTKPRKTPTWSTIAGRCLPSPASGLPGGAYAALKQTRSVTIISSLAFLTTDANGIVGPVHPKAMPVLLTTAEERDVWLRRRGQKLALSNGLCPTR